MSTTHSNQESLPQASDAEHVAGVAHERISVMKNAQRNAHEALTATNTAMVGNVASDMFRPKTGIQSQEPIIVGDQTAADRVMQANDFALLESDPHTSARHNDYVRAVADLDPSQKKTQTPPTDEQLARDLVSQALTEVPVFTHPDLQTVPAQEDDSVMQMSDAVDELFTELGIDGSIFESSDSAMESV